MLVNGKWHKDFHPVQAEDDEGGFERQDSVFRNWITIDGSPGPTGTGGFKAEADRYHLYIALICPWASRTLMARKLKGLENIISVSVLDPRLTEKVWQFGGSPDSLALTDTEPFYGAKYLYEIYLRATSDYTGQITVPVLWDKHQETIVNNESSEIIRMLNDGFGDLATQDINLYPQSLQPQINKINERLYNSFNNGVYRAGFATTQYAYEKAVTEVVESLEFLEQHLDGKKYLVGEHLTEADIRAFVTLIRFDLAYHGLFKINLRQVRDYPNLRSYLQHIYQLEGIKDTVNVEHIKAGYYSVKALNPTEIVPLGPATLW